MENNQQLIEDPMDVAADDSEGSSSVADQSLVAGSSLVASEDPSSVAGEDPSSVACEDPSSIAYEDISSVSPESPSSLTEVSNALITESKEYRNVFEIKEMSTPENERTPSTSKSKEISKSIKEMKIGFIGVGPIALGIVKCLLKANIKLIIWHPQLQILRKLLSDGAVTSGCSKSIFEMADVIFSFATVEASKKLVLRAKMFLKHKSYIQLTPVDQETSNQLAQFIAVHCNGGYLEAPVHGTPADALKGQLLLMASGNQRVYQNCIPIFEKFTIGHYYLGLFPGQATNMKAIMGTLEGVAVAAISEGIALAKELNLEPKVLVDILCKHYFKKDFFLATAKSMLSNQFQTVEKPIFYQQKDLTLALNLSEGGPLENQMVTIKKIHEMFEKIVNIKYIENIKENDVGMNFELFDLSL